VCCPSGYWAPSIRAYDQGFAGEDCHPTYLVEHATARKVWAAISINYFLYMVHRCAGQLQHAKDQRDMWSRMEEMEAVMERVKGILDHYENKE
jgi:hypothetical protein